MSYICITFGIIAHMNSAQLQLLLWLPFIVTESLSWLSQVIIGLPSTSKRCHLPPPLSLRKTDFSFEIVIAYNMQYSTARYGKLSSLNYIWNYQFIYRLTIIYGGWWRTSLYVVMYVVVYAYMLIFDDTVAM